MAWTRRAALRALGAAFAVPTMLRGGLAATAPMADLCVAGGGHHGLGAAREGLRVGMSVVLRREPGNAHDPNAVELLDEAGRKLGYVPRALAARLAPRLDAARPVAARVVRFRGDGSAVDADAPALWTTDWQVGDPVVRLTGDAPLDVPPRTS